MATRGNNGLEGSGTPWLTYALLLALALLFVLERMQENELRTAAASRLSEAKAYLLEHPLLEVPPLLRPEVGQNVENLRRREEHARIERGAPPTPPGVVRRQQAELDHLIAEATEGLEGSPVYAWGLEPSARRRVTWLTHAFVHAGWPQLLGNGVLILALGYYLEAAWGPVLLALFSVAATVGTAAVFSTLRPTLDATLAGSTGLLAALLGAFLVRMSSLAGNSSYWFVLLLGAVWIGLPAWLGAEWSVADAADGTPASVLAPGASLLFAAIGSGLGASLALGIRLCQFEEVFVAPARGGHSSRAKRPALERARASQALGRDEEAVHLLQEALATDDASADPLVLWDVATAMSRPADAAAAMLRVIRDDVRRGDREAAVAHWLEVEERGLSADADVTLLIRIAGFLRGAEQSQAALRALQRALTLGERGGSPVVASRVARAARDLDVETAESAAWRALGSLDLDYEERQSLEEMLGELYATRDPDLEVRRTHTYGKEDPRETQRAAPAPEATGDEAERPKPIDLDLASRALQATVVTPLGLEGRALCVEMPDGTKRLVELDRVDALAVAAVHGLGPKPVILVDLVFNWVALRDEPLQVMRMRGDRFDPRRLSPGRDSALEALRDFLARIQECTSATPLPDAEAVVGRPFAVLDDLNTYQRDVLLIDEDPT